MNFVVLAIVLFIGILLIILHWERICRYAKNLYAYLFLDDTKYYWTSIHKPIYVNTNLYPNHVVVELRGYWKDGVYHEITPNIPFKKEMVEKFEGCKVFVTIVDMETRKLEYIDLIINNGKFW